jgi:hypothetical protein
MDNNEKSGCFCQECGREKIFYSLFKSKYCIFCRRKTLSNYKIFVSDTLNIKESLKIRHKRKEFGKFISETINGWFPSHSYPWGVAKQRVVDREKNEYHEVVKDLKSGKIIRNCHESLDRHKNKKLIEK